MGVFGGSVEEGETVIEGLIREAGEELDLDLTPDDVILLFTFNSLYESNKYINHLYLYKTEKKSFTDLEAGGAHWLSFEVAKSRLNKHHRLDEVLQMIEKHM